jgi:hypothetical protein
VRRPPPPLSLFSLARLPEGLNTGEVFTTAAHRRATEFLNPVRTDLLPQSLLYRTPKGHHWSPHMCEYAEVLPMWHRSHWAEFFTTLRSATSATSSMLVREHNPAIGLVHHWSSDHYNITNWRGLTRQMSNMKVRIGGVGRRMNSKVKSVKHGVYRK